MHKDGLKEITVHTQIAIGFREYTKARKCIAVNFSNEGITPEEQQKLNIIDKKIILAIRKTTATNMILDGNYSIREIIEKSGLKEIDVLGLRNKLLNNRENSSEIQIVSLDE